MARGRGRTARRRHDEIGTQAVSRPLGGRPRRSSSAGRGPVSRRPPLAAIPARSSGGRGNPVMPGSATSRRPPTPDVREGRCTFGHLAGQSGLRSGGWACGRRGAATDRLVMATDFTDTADHHAVLHPVRQASRRRPSAAVMAGEDPHTQAAPLAPAACVCGSLPALPRAARPGGPV